MSKSTSVFRLSVFSLQHLLCVIVIVDECKDSVNEC